MIKYFFTILIIFSIIQSINAQNEIGLKGGLNLSKVSMDLEDNYTDPKIGYHIGLFSSVTLTNNLSLSPELLISEKGYKDTPATYVSIPALINIRILEKFYIEAGPEFDLLIIDGSFGKKFQFQFWEKDIKVGFDVGLKADISAKIICNIRYNYGLSSVMDIQFTDRNGPIDVKVYNRNLQLSVGYKFNP